MSSDHPLEPMRRKEPVEKLMQDSHASLDHVLGYLTLKMHDHPRFDELEADILAMFEANARLTSKLRGVVPADDMGDGPEKEAKQP